MSKTLLKIWALSLVVKLALSALVPLAPDESYYWIWARFLDWSYYDHPGMVAWLFKLSSPLSNFGSAVRWPFVILGHTSFLFWLKSFDFFQDGEQRERFKRAWLLTVILSPLLGLGSMVATPDVPLLFFWSLSFYLLCLALFQGSALAYAALGVSLGLGFCSKYMIVLFVPCTLLLLANQTYRRMIRWRYVPLTVITGLFFCLPVLGWNYTHDWVSFKFQADHGLGAKKWKLEWILVYTLGQVFIIFPTFFYFFCRAVKNLKLQLIYFIFAAFPLVFFFATSFKGRVEANWPITAYPSVYVVALIPMLAQAQKTLRASLAIWTALLILVFSQVAFEWLPIKSGQLKISEHRIFDPILVDMATNEPNVPVFMSTYQMASTLSFKTKKIYYKLPGINRKDMFDFWYPEEQVPANFIMYVDRQFHLPRPLRTNFQIIKEQMLDANYKKVFIARKKR